MNRKAIIIVNIHCIIAYSDGALLLVITIPELLQEMKKGVMVACHYVCSDRKSHPEIFSISLEIKQNIVNSISM